MTIIILRGVSVEFIEADGRRWVSSADVSHALQYCLFSNALAAHGKHVPSTSRRRGPRGRTFLDFTGIWAIWPHLYHAGKWEIFGLLMAMLKRTDQARYLLFYGDLAHYATKWSDCVGEFSSVQSAFAHVSSSPLPDKAPFLNGAGRRYQLVDTVDGYSMELKGAGFARPD